MTTKKTKHHSGTHLTSSSNTGITNRQGQPTMSILGSGITTAIQVTCEQLRPCHGISPPQVAISRAVRFANQAQRAAPGPARHATQIEVKAALDTKPDLQPIKDLSASISRVQGARHEVWLILLHDEIVRQKFKLNVFPTTILPAAH